MAHRGDVPLDGRAPLLLAAYGAYGECLEADFRAERLCLLAAGWVVALAHVRGGGELGRSWHAAGRGVSKMNSVADLEACMDHLVSQGAPARDSASDPGQRSTGEPPTAVGEPIS